jgi:hypothetical protein
MPTSPISHAPRHALIGVCSRMLTYAHVCGRPFFSPHADTLFFFQMTRAWAADRKARGGLWHAAADRLFILEDLMLSVNASHLLSGASPHY